MNAAINEPTIRKVINRGWIPVVWHSPYGYRNGWIWKIGRKYIYLRADNSVKKIPLKNVSTIKELRKGKSSIPVVLDELRERLCKDKWESAND
jgi:hypothetical protein